MIHKLWGVGLEGISREVHPTERVEVTAGTFREFVNDYLAENGRIIQMIGQLSINDSFQLFGVTD